MRMGTGPAGPSKLPFAEFRRQPHPDSPRIEGEHLNRRIVHFRQRRYRKLKVRNPTSQKQRRHQQSRRHWTQNKWPRGIHWVGAALPLVLFCPCVWRRATTWTPFSRRSNPLVARLTPAFTPCTAVFWSSLVSVVIGCTLTALLGWRTYTNAAVPLCYTAAEGTSVTFRSVLTSRRAFTN